MVLTTTRIQTIASCFDCIHLEDPPDPSLKNRAYHCGVYGRLMSYDLARTPNDCGARESEEDNVANQVILDRLFGQIQDLIERIHRPFTMRELFDYSNDYENKNSLWELTESLVREGRLEKRKSSFRTHRGQHYAVNVYWPILR